MACWRPALMRRAVLDDVVRSDGVPSADHMAATLDLVMQAIHDSPWLADIAQIRTLLEREGRMRRIGDLAQLREVATAIADGLSLAQAGSEQAWSVVVNTPAGREAAAVWLEQGLRRVQAGDRAMSAVTFAVVVRFMLRMAVVALLDHDRCSSFS